VFSSVALKKRIPKETVGSPLPVVRDMIGPDETPERNVSENPWPNAKRTWPPYGRTFRRKLKLNALLSSLKLPLVVKDRRLA
jgi:hypothetical protein